MRNRPIALLTAIGLAASPAAAQPAAQALSIERAGAAPGDSRLDGPVLLPALAFGLIVIGGVLLAAGVFDGDDDAPASP